MKHTVLLAVGLGFAALASLEVVRTWAPPASIDRLEPFAADAEAIREVEAARARASRSAIVAAGARDLSENVAALGNARVETLARLDDNKRAFVRLANRQLDDLRAAVETRDGIAERELESLRGKISAVESAKLSKDEFARIADQIRDEIAEAQTLSAGRDSAFLAAMNHTLDAEDLEQNRVIKDIEAAYATKAESVEVEKRITELAALSRETSERLDAGTERIVKSLDRLASVKGALADFEKRNLQLPGGGTAGVGLVDELDAIKRDALARVEKLESTADALVRCEAQTGLGDRVKSLEKDVRKAIESCEDSRSVCKPALGQGPLVMKSDARVLLGDTGKSLVMRGNALKICDADGPDSTCHNLAASIGQ